MTKFSAPRPVLGVVGLFSVLVLANHTITTQVNADTGASGTTTQADAQVSSNAQSSVRLNSSTPKTNVTTQAQAAGTIAEAAFQLTNQHANSSVESANNRSMGSILNTQALAALTDETGSTSTKHILRAPAGLDEVTSAKWLTIAKQQAKEDQAKTGRSQQIIMVSATASTVKSFAIGQDNTVPSVDAVDVASYQSWMTQANYNQLKAAGVKAVVVKISEGSTYANPYAADQIKYAQAAGLKVSVYHFARFTSVKTATAEAAKTADTLKQLGLSSSTMIFADMEASETNSSSVVANLNQYWKTLNANGYTNHGVYTGGLYGESYANATSGTVGNANTWYAQYPYTPSKNKLLNTQYGAWQFSSSAYLPEDADKPIDTSVDYDGLFSQSYDAILSNKAMAGVMQINQTNRKDGIYVSGPYNTDASTTKVNTDATKYNGQIVQLLRQARTKHSTYDQVMTTTGAKFWIDVHGVTAPVPDAVLANDTQDYYALINQSTRKDGVYVNGPYRTTPDTYWPNSDGPKYDQQLVHVIKTERTRWSTYAQVVQSNGNKFWIDIHALSKPTYYPILTQKNVSYDAQVDEALHTNGVVDGIYASGPYRTSADTYEINTDSKRYDGQSGHVDQEATNSHSTYAHITLTDGKAFWIDVHGLRQLKFDKIIKQSAVNYDVQIDEASRPHGIVDGTYSSGPYRTSLDTSVINFNGAHYDQQYGHVDKQATTSHSTYSHVTLTSGTAFWIDSHAVKRLTYYPIKSSKNVNYNATIDESLHKNGVIDGVYVSGPYRTSIETYAINEDSKKYDGQRVHVTKEATNSHSTYAYVSLSNGKQFWIDVHGLRR